MHSRFRAVFSAENLVRNAWRRRPGLTDEHLAGSEKHASPATISAAGGMRQFTLWERAEVRRREAFVRARNSAERHPEIVLRPRDLGIMTSFRARDPSVAKGGHRDDNSASSNGTVRAVTAS
jgi:hypothetical protein